MGATPSRDYWKLDSQCTNCDKCKAAFSFTKRKHHCRSCGGIFCGKCCFRKTTVPLRGIQTEERVCDTCYYGIVAPSASPSFQNPNGGPAPNGIMGNSSGGQVGSLPRGSPISTACQDPNQGSPFGVDALPARPSAARQDPVQTRADELTKVPYIDIPLPPESEAFYDEPEDYPTVVTMAPSMIETAVLAPFPKGVESDFDVVSFLSSEAVTKDLPMTVSLHGQVTTALEQIDATLEAAVRQAFQNQYTPSLPPSSV